MSLLRPSLDSEVNLLFLGCEGNQVACKLFLQVTCQVLAVKYQGLLLLVLGCVLLDLPLKPYLGIYRY